MSAGATSSPDSDEQFVLDEDLPCPECEYNLRGLTTPRCPECGHRFAWADLPEMRSSPEPKTDWCQVVGVGIVVLVGAVAFLGPATPAIIVLPLVILASFVVSVVQSAIELSAASAVIGLPGWRLFRAWWEGVLIGYGVASLTLHLAGHPFIPIESFGTWGDSLRLWPWLLLVAVEATAVQWWVVGRRMRGWDEPIKPRRLLLACLAGRALTVVPWLYLARFVMQ